MKRKLLLIKAIESHCRFRFSKIQILRMLSHDINSLKKMARFVAKAEKITPKNIPIRVVRSRVNAATLLNERNLRCKTL
jgi:hypothetical protein